MSDDIEQKRITGETAQIIEDAINKIHNLYLLSDPRNGRRDVAAFIRWYIDVKYFHLPPDDQSKWPKGGASEDLAKNGTQRAAETMEAILRGDIDPVQLRKAAEVVGAALDISPARENALDKRTVALLYKEYCGKYGISKAEFVRRIIKRNQITVPRARRKGISSTNFNNVYRELSRLLKKERINTD